MSKRKHVHAKHKSKVRWFIIGGIVILVLVAVVAAFLYKPAPAADTGNNISVEEAYAKYQAGVFLLDVRSQEEWNEYHVPNTTLIPLDQLADRLGELPRDQEIVVICRSGNRSQKGRDTLLDAGFTNVTSMRDGLKEWSAQGYPLEGTRP